MYERTETCIARHKTGYANGSIEPSVQYPRHQQSLRTGPRGFGGIYGFITPIQRHPVALPLFNRWNSPCVGGRQTGLDASSGWTWTVRESEERLAVIELHP